MRASDWYADARVGGGGVEVGGVEVVRHSRPSCVPWCDADIFRPLLCALQRCRCLGSHCIDSARCIGRKKPRCVARAVSRSVPFRGWFGSSLEVRPAAAVRHVPSMAGKQAASERAGAMAALFKIAAAKVSEQSEQASRPLRSNTRQRLTDRSTRFNQPRRRTEQF